MVNGSKVIRSSNSYKLAKYNVDLIHTSSKGRLTMVVGRSVFFVGEVAFFNPKTIPEISVSKIDIYR